MRIDYEFPAVVRVRTPRSHAEKHVLCRMSGQGEIRELSEDEAPMAAVVTRKDGRSKYRAVEGGLFASVGRFSDLRRGVGAKRLLRRASVEMGMLRMCHEELSAVPRAFVAPDEAALVLAEASRPAVFHRPPDVFVDVKGPGDRWSLLPSFDRYRSSPHSEDDVERWRATADGMLDGIVLCDDKVWIKVPEPCLSVVTNRNSVYTTHADVAFYSQGASEPRIGTPPKEMSVYWRDIDETCFGLTEWRQARAFAEDHAASIMRGSRTPNVTSDVLNVQVTEPSAFVFDFATAEFRRLADRLFHQGTEAMRLPSRPAVWRRNVPDDFVEALLAFEAARAVDGDNMAELEAAVEGFHEAVSVLRPELERLGFRTDDVLRVIARGLDRWDERPIGLGSDLGPIGMAVKHPL